MTCIDCHKGVAHTPPGAAGRGASLNPRVPVRRMYAAAARGQFRAILKLTKRLGQNSSRLSHTVEMLKREISPIKSASAVATRP